MLERRRLMLTLLLALAGLLPRARALQELQGLLSGSDRPEAIESAYDSKLLGAFPRFEALVEKGDAALEARELERATDHYLEALGIMEARERPPFEALDPLRRTLVGLFLIRGKPLEAHDHAQELLRSRRREAADDPRLVAEAYRLVAAVEIARVRPLQAQVPADAAARLARERLGGGDPDTARAELVQAAAAFLAGETARAERLADRALKSLEAALGPGALDLAFFLPMRAAIHLSEGEFEAAEGVLERALTAQTESLGAEHPYLIGTLYQLASFQLATDRVRQAIATLERALEISTGTYGEDHGLNAALLDVLVDAEVMHKDYEASWNHMARSLAIRKRLFGEEAPELGASLVRQARLLGYRGQFREALATARRAADLSQRAFGSDHPAMSRCWMTLAFAYFDAGDWIKARRFQRRAVDQLARRVGRHSPVLAGIRFQVALLDVGMDDPGRALLNLESLDDLLRKEEEHHQLLLGLIAALRGIAQMNLYRTEEALASLRKAEEIFEGVVKETRRIMGIVWHPMARCLIDAGDLPRAREYSERFQALVHENPEDPGGWLVYEEVQVRAALALGKPAVAFQWAERSLQRCRKAYGEGHPFEVRILRLRGRAEAAGKRHAQALATARQALSQAEAAYRPEDLEIGLCKLALAERLDATGAPAGRLAREALPILTEHLGAEATRTRRAEELSTP